MNGVCRVVIVEYAGWEMHVSVEVAENPEVRAKVVAALRMISESFKGDLD